MGSNVPRPRDRIALQFLMFLVLGSNSLSGSVPLELGYSSSLSDVDLGHNVLSGPLFPSIWNLCDRLAYLKLHGNSLTGPLPEPALPNNSTCERLKILDLSDYKFSGAFPEYITRFRNVQELDLSHNMLNGTVPMSLTGLKLEKLDLSYNNYSGLLPNFEGSKFGVEAFEGNNPSLCGLPLRSCSANSGLSSKAIVGLVIGLMTGVVVAASLLIGFLQNKRKRNADQEEEIEEGYCWIVS